MDTKYRNIQIPAVSQLLLNLGKGRLRRFAADNMIKSREKAFYFKHTERYNANVNLLSFKLAFFNQLKPLSQCHSDMTPTLKHSLCLDNLVIIKSFCIYIDI